MPSTETRVEVAIGLVYQSGDLHAHLRDALRDSGASIVYETETAAFDRAALARSGAQVVIVNLDPDSDEQLEAIDDLLVDDAIKVVFNDGEVSSKLAGYDLARWARHLAAKIVGDAELLPPRPVGAEAVPVRSMPQHALTTTQMPKSLDAPSVSDDSMRHATDAIADALASFDMHATKLEAKNAPVADDLSALLGDFGLAGSASPTSPAASTAENPFADLGLELDLSEQTAAVTPATPASPEAERAAPPAQLEDELLAFADLDFSEPTATVGAAEGLDDLLAKQAPRAEARETAAATDAPAAPVLAPRSSLLDALTLSLEPQDDAPTVAVPANTTAAVEFDFPFDLDGLTLEPLDDASAAPAATVAASTPASAPAPQPAKAPPPPVEDNPFADLGLSLEPLDGEPVAAAAPVATTTAVASPFDGLDFALEDLSSDAADTAPAADVGFSARLDETLELSFGDIGLGSNEPATASSGEEDDFMREFAAMTAVAEATPVGPVVNTPTGAIRRVWVLGASIGGPDAVREFLANIPASVQACFVLAQHMGADFVELMIAQLQKATPLPVAIASAGMSAGHGQVLVAPIAERMLLDPSGEVKVVALDDASPYSPSIDRVLIDVADRFGADAGAIIFSGMAHDAIEGAKHMAAKGGSVWVQDPATCVVSSMIDGAMEAGIVSFIGTPVDLAAEFVRRFGKA